MIRRNSVRQLHLVVTAAALALALSACSGSGESSEQEGPSASATPTSVAPEIVERAKTAVIDDPTVLPEGWNPVAASKRFGSPPGRPQYCGVFADPDPVLQSALVVYERSADGPSVLQYTFVSTQEAATAVLTELEAAAGDCREDGFDIETIPALETYGDQRVGFDYVSDQGVGSRIVVFRERETVVVLVGYGAQGVPEDEVADIAGTVSGLLS